MQLLLSGVMVAVGGGGVNVKVGAAVSDGSSVAVAVGEAVGDWGCLAQLPTRKEKMIRNVLTDFNLIFHRPLR